jgi:hypothetical protein
MTPVLRHLSTGLYFKGGASWTNHVNEALVYPDVEAALDAASSSSMAGLELNVILFNDACFTMRLNLDESLRKRAEEFEPWYARWRHDKCPTTTRESLSGAHGLSPANTAMRERRPD